MKLVKVSCADRFIIERSKLLVNGYVVFSGSYMDGKYFCQLFVLNLEDG